MKYFSKIESDQQFLEQLEEAIKELNKIGSQDYFVKKLKHLKDIALKRSELKMSQERYISILRALDETGSFSCSLLGNKIATLINYFAYNLKIE